MLFLLRRSHGGSRKSALHGLSAWSKNNRLILRQCRSEGKKNEIVSAQILIEMLELKGAVVTMDAMHCQKKTAPLLSGSRVTMCCALKRIRNNCSGLFRLLS